MGIFSLFTFLLLPILLGALSHFCSDCFCHRKQKPKQKVRQDNNLISKAAKPLILPYKSLPRLIIEAKALRRMAMDEKQNQKRMARKLSIRQINVEEVQTKAQEQAQFSSTISTGPLQSPLRSPSLKKSLSGKLNCLCAPTTHAGSFRCRLHRNGSSFRRISIGSDLNELDAKSSLTAAPLETT